MPRSNSKQCTSSQVFLAGIYFGLQKAAYSSLWSYSTHENWGLKKPHKNRSGRTSDPHSPCSALPTGGSIPVSRLLSTAAEWSLCVNTVICLLPLIGPSALLTLCASAWSAQGNTTVSLCLAARQSHQGSQSQESENQGSLHDSFTLPAFVTAGNPLRIWSLVSQSWLH